MEGMNVPTSLSVDDEGFQSVESSSSNTYSSWITTAERFLESTGIDKEAGSALQGSQNDQLLPVITGIKDSSDQGSEKAVVAVTATTATMKGPARSTTALLREAARYESLRFMPQVSKMLDDPKLSPQTKVKLFELLMDYGVGKRQQSKETASSVTNIQTAVVALQPRVQAEAVLAAPVAIVDTAKPSNGPLEGLRQRALLALQP